MHIPIRTIKVYCFTLLFLCLSLTASSQVSYEEAFPNISFNVPVEIQNAKDGSDRIFVLEQQGIIKVFPNNKDVTSNQVGIFLDMSEKVSYSSGQEIGLLGLAFHPQFTANRYVFVYYIDKPSNYRINIVRYQVSSSDSNKIDPSTETIIAQYTKNIAESNHNGGKIAFGPDGYLYVSIGDGGGGGDPNGNGQNLNTVFGSILRIDIDVNGDNPLESNPELPNGNYEIPSDNPRVGQSGLDELYAWGIRNTWKFSFDTAGRLWGADVGQNAYEEINLITKGGNFGWNRFEANSDYQPNTGLVTTPDTKPIFFYNHNEGDKSITGGYMYRGSLTSSSVQDKYIYGDFTTGRVWALSYNPSNGSATTNLLFRASGQSISSFGEDEAGEIYFSGYGNNAKLFKLTETISEPVTTVVNGVGEWKGITNGTNGNVETIVQGSDNTRYVGGSFTRAGGITVSNLALITPDEKWQAFGTGSNGPIFSIKIAPNGNVFVGGEFSQIGGINANNIAVWNGSVWSALGTGTSGPILELAFDTQGTLFVGGIFTNAGGLAVNNIAKWQNSNWSALTDATTGVAGINNEVRSLAFDTNNNLYVGGNFDAAGSISTPRIARWNGTNWSALGTGTSGFVQAIAVADNYVYAGGNFNLAGTKTANRIARWNLTNSSWETLGFGLSGSVNALAADGAFVYVGGDFETASDIENINKTVNNIARWSTAKGWEALGPNTKVGANSSIATMFLNTTRPKELSVGGNFSSAGGSTHNNFAIWGEVFCKENTITPEYQVNGVWNSGGNALTLTEGSTLVLSILGNETIFTITLPNGTVITGDYNLGRITPNMSGTYTFTTALGCVESMELLINASTDRDNDGVENGNDTCPDTPNGEPVNASGCSPSQLDDDSDGVSNADDQCPNTPADLTVDIFGCDASKSDADNDGIPNSEDSCPYTPEGETPSPNGCSISQLDDDTDGINNDIDQCPGTPIGAEVNATGCEVSDFPDGQFLIATTANSCATAVNGQINIGTTISDNYSATLWKGAQVIDDYEFTNVLDIQQLDGGSYSICIRSESLPNLESCYPFNIEDSETLDVVTGFTDDGTNLILRLQGAQTYFITLNGKNLETDEEEITLLLDRDVNELRVSSDSPCQGIYQETIVLKDSFIVYPNPIKDFVTIDVTQLTDDKVAVSLFSVTGELFIHEEHTTEGGSITLNTSSLPYGYFLLRLSGKSINKGFKLIK